MKSFFTTEIRFLHFFIFRSSITRTSYMFSTVTSPTIDGETTHLRGVHTYNSLGKTNLDSYSRKSLNQYVKMGKLKFRTHLFADLRGAPKDRCIN